MRSNCPKCRHLLIEPVGQSKWLLVGDAPSWIELKASRPLAGDSLSIVISELMRYGYSIDDFRITNLWLHGKNGDCDPKWHLDQLAKELKRATHVLLMGNEVCKELTGKPSMALAGTKVKLRDWKKLKVWASPNPSMAINNPVGDLRMSLRRFCGDLK